MGKDLRGIWIYRLNKSLAQWPRVWINETFSPCATAVVAAPILKECPEYREQLRLALLGFAASVLPGADELEGCCWPAEREVLVPSPCSCYQTRSILCSTDVTGNPYTGLDPLIVITISDRYSKLSMAMSCGVIFHVGSKLTGKLNTNSPDRRNAKKPRQQAAHKIRLSWHWGSCERTSLILTSISGVIGNRAWGFIPEEADPVS